MSPIKSQPLILGEARMKLFNNEFSNFSLSKQFPCVFLIFFSERSYSKLSRRRLFSPNLFGFFERAFSLLFQRGMRSHLVLISRYFKLEGPSHLVVSKLLQSLIFLKPEFDEFSSINAIDHGVFLKISKQFFHKIVAETVLCYCPLC